MNKTTLEEVMQLAMKYDSLAAKLGSATFTFTQLAALIDEVRTTQPPQDERGQGQSDDALLAREMYERMEHSQPVSHEFAVRLSEYGVAMAHRQSEKARVLAEVLQSMFDATQPRQDECGGGEPEFCPKCGGSGESTVMSDGGPDAYEVSVDCPHCEGRQTMAAAYEGVVKLLRIEEKKYRECAAILWLGRPDRRAHDRLREIADYVMKTGFSPEWARDRLLALADMASVASPTHEPSAKLTPLTPEQIAFGLEGNLEDASNEEELAFTVGVRFREWMHNGDKTAVNVCQSDPAPKMHCFACPAKENDYCDLDCLRVIASHPAAPLPEQNYAKCWVCGKPMDGKSEDDCHCFHRKEFAAQPVALSTLTDEQIVAIAKRAIAAGELIWMGFQKDEDGRYTVPELQPSDFKLVRAVLAAASAPAKQAEQARAYVSGDEAHRELQWMPDMPSFDLPVGTKLYVATTPQPVAAEVVTNAERMAVMQSEPIELEDIERYRMQMAGIMTASLGYWKEGDAIHPDYDTIALRDVAKLYAKYDALFQARDAAMAGTGSDESKKGEA